MFRFIMFLTLALTLMNFNTTYAQDQQNKEETKMEMQIIKSGTIPSVGGPEDYFTGQAHIDDMFTAPEPSKLSVALVTFEPKARTAWHTHPYGQTLLVTEGNGWVQCEGEERQDIAAGDIVYFPPHIRHWHGATDNTTLKHYAIQESKDGSPVTWQEHVEDADYNK